MTSCTFHNICGKLREWTSHNFCFCEGVFFASGLAFSDRLIDFSILALLITYIVELDSKSTAILVMIQEGLSTLLQIFMSYISYAIFSRFQIIIVSSCFYISGLLLFFLRIRGIWNISAPVFIGILLLAVGQAGVQPLIREFVFDQYKNHEPDQENPDMGRVRARENTWYRVVGGFSSIVAFLTFSYADQSGPTTLKVSLVATVSSLILFLLGTRFYHEEDLGDRAYTCRSRFVTSLLNPKVLAIKLFGRRNRVSTPDNHERKMWKRWWTIFLVFGLVLSGGMTFFPYQGENMYHSNYLSSLVIMKSISRGIICNLFEILPSRYANMKKLQLVRIGFGMLMCIPCFLVARWIEFRRLNSLEEISIFWLVPEFCMLGISEGLAKNGLDEFMIGLFSESRKEYVSTFNTLVIGLGNFANILLFLAYQSWRKRQGKNEYILPRYFLILTIISAVILLIYSVLSIRFCCKHTPETSQTAENGELGRVRTEEDPEREQTDNLDLVNTEEEGLERPIEGGLGDNAAVNHERSHEGGGGSDVNTGIEARSQAPGRIRTDERSQPGDSSGGARDQENQPKCLSDFLSACF